MKNQPRIFFAYVFALIFLFVFLGIPYQNGKVTSDFRRFYENKIEGVIVQIERFSRNSAFTINNSSSTFNWFPYMNKALNEDKIFSDFASPGDSVFKAPYSDTLFLFKNGKAYKYTFQKFE